jgi:E3 ubiquitin-protein ligase MARCH6
MHECDDVRTRNLAGRRQYSLEPYRCDPVYPSLEMEDAVSDLQDHGNAFTRSTEMSREPLSEVPVDLLFVHLILPPTLHYFRPRKAVRRLMTGWWRWAARQLRLTSFMFGGRHQNEEYTPDHWSWRTLFSSSEDEPLDMEAVHDGSFRRAPAGDNIAFLRDKPALVVVDEHGMALNEGGRATIWAQNAEAHHAGRNFQDDYTVVYVPPHFRRRIFLFILLFWLSGSIATVSAVVIPILLGRAVFGLFIPRQVHDGYSLALGFYVLWWSWLVGTLVVRIRIRRQRHEGSRRIRASWLLFLFKRVFVYVTKVAWLVLWLGFVLPTLVSIAVDLYLVIPLRFFLNPNFTPTIHVVESWAAGLVLSKIMIRTQRTRPGTDLTGALEAVRLLYAYYERCN